MSHSVLGAAVSVEVEVRVQLVHVQHLCGGQAWQCGPLQWGSHPRGCLASYCTDILHEDRSAWGTSFGLIASIDAFFLLLEENCLHN